MTEKWERMPDEAFFLSLLTSASSVPGQEEVNVEQQFSTHVVGVNLGVYKLE